MSDKTDTVALLTQAFTALEAASDHLTAWAVALREHVAALETPVQDARDLSRLLGSGFEWTQDGTL